VIHAVRTGAAALRNVSSLRNQKAPFASGITPYTGPWGQDHPFASSAGASAAEQPPAARSSHVAPPMRGPTRLWLTKGPCWIANYVFLRSTCDDRTAEGCSAALAPADDARGRSRPDQGFVTMDPGREGCLLISDQGPVRTAWITLASTPSSPSPPREEERGLGGEQVGVYSPAG
jgi:hypothetical protein